MISLDSVLLIFVIFGLLVSWVLTDPIKRLLKELVRVSSLYTYDDLSQPESDDDGLFWFFLPGGDYVSLRLISDNFQSITYCQGGSDEEMIFHYSRIQEGENWYFCSAEEQVRGGVGFELRISEELVPAVNRFREFVERMHVAHQAETGMFKSSS